MTMKPCSGQSGPRGGRDAKYPLQHTLAQVSCARWRCTVTGTPLACTSTERSAPGAVHAVRARDTAKEERRRPRGRAAAAGVRLGCLPPPERRERAAAAAGGGAGRRGAGQRLLLEQLRHGNEGEAAAHFVKDSWPAVRRRLEHVPACPAAVPVALQTCGKQPHSQPPQNCSKWTANANDSRSPWHGAAAPAGLCRWCMPVTCMKPAHVATTDPEPHPRLTMGMRDQMPSLAERKRRTQE